MCTRELYAIFPIINLFFCKYTVVTLLVSSIRGDTRRWMYIACPLCFPGCYRRASRRRNVHFCVICLVPPWHNIRRRETDHRGASRRTPPSQEPPMVCRASLCVFLSRMAVCGGTRTGVRVAGWQADDGRDRGNLRPSVLVCLLDSARVARLRQAETLNISSNFPQQQPLGASNHETRWYGVAD